MNPSLITQVGVGGIFVLLVLRELKPYLLNGKGKYISFSEIERKQLNKLYQWHSPDAETGRFSWYSRDSEMISAIKEQTEAIKELIILLKTRN